MRCGKCGEYWGGQKFCTKCGKELMRECEKCGEYMNVDEEFCGGCGRKNPIYDLKGMKSD